MKNCSKFLFLLVLSLLVLSPQFFLDKKVYAENMTQYAVEVWVNSQLFSGYDTLPEAFSSIQSNMIVKINENIQIPADAIGTQNSTKNYITITGSSEMPISIVIEGNGKTIDNSLWLKNIFTINEFVSLTINDLTIDGGATAWEIDFENAIWRNKNYSMIPLKNYENENKATAPVIVSAGSLTCNNITIQDVYTTNGDQYNTGTPGAGISCTAGSVSLNKSNFLHLAAKYGAGLSVEGNISAANTTEYPISKVVINECNFQENYATSSGGAIRFLNCANMEILNSKFYKNCVYTNGGAIVVESSSTKKAVDDNGTPSDPSDDFEYQTTDAEQKGLTAPQLNIKNCYFIENQAGNDGFALQTREAGTNIENCLFQKNIGINTSGCLGTVYYSCYRREWITHIINNCQFIENFGSASCIGDNASNAKVIITNTSFDKNSGTMSMLFYNSNVELEGVTFTNENVTNCVIDAKSYSTKDNYYFTETMTGPFIKFNNSSITGTKGSDIDIAIRAYNSDTKRLNFSSVFVNDTVANILISDHGSVTIDGKHNGNIILDANSTKANLVLTDNAVVDNVIYQDSYSVKILCNMGGVVDDLGNVINNFQKNLNLKKGQYTENDILEMLEITNDGHKLEFYTDDARTNKWDLIVSKPQTIYAKWVEHTHDYNLYKVLDNSIVECCECGKLTGKYISIGLPQNMVYDGNIKYAVVQSNLLQNIDYTVLYKKKYADNVYVTIENPIDAGEYKACLKYNELETQIDFNIQKANYDISNIYLSNLTFEYDGEEHILEIANLPAGVTVTYENNIQSNIGSYLVVVHFAGDNNYNAIDDMIAILTITPKQEVKVVINDILLIVASGVVLLLTLIILFKIIVQIKGNKRDRELLDKLGK